MHRRERRLQSADAPDLATAHRPVGKDVAMHHLAEETFRSSPPCITLARFVHSGTIAALPGPIALASPTAFHRASSHLSSAASTICGTRSSHPSGIRCTPWHMPFISRANSAAISTETFLRSSFGVSFI